MAVFNDDHVAARVGVETRKVAVGFRRIELGGDLVKNKIPARTFLCCCQWPIFRSR